MEYALTAAILSVVLLTGADTLGSVVNDTFMSMSNKLVVASQQRSHMAGGTRLIAMESTSPEQAIGAVDNASTAPKPTY